MLRSSEELQGNRGGALAACRAIESRPAIVENWLSSGVATAAAMVSGEAPGRLAVTEMVGNQRWATRRRAR